MPKVKQLRGNKARIQTQSFSGVIVHSMAPFCLLNRVQIYLSFRASTFLLPRVPLYCLFMLNLLCKTPLLWECLSLKLITMCFHHSL